MRAGLRGVTFESLFDRVVVPASVKFSPDAVVVQCGADGLVGDPAGEWNLSIQSVAACVTRVVGLKRPVLLLGGGMSSNFTLLHFAATLCSLL